MFFVRAQLYRFSALGFIFATLLSACVDESPDEFIASAQSYLTQGNPAAAAIQVRNALQRRPEDGALRLLLGRALLENRDPVAAEREFRKALQYGQPTDSVVPLLARSILEQDNPDRLVEELAALTMLTPEAEAAFKSTLGHAQLRSRRAGNGLSSFNTSLAAVPGYLPAQIGIARVAALEGKLDDAVRRSDRLVEEHPASAEVHMLAADLAAMRSNPAASIAALEQAIRVDAGHLAARYALVAALIDDERFDAAELQLEQARKLARSDLRIHYFDAAIALARGDAINARQASQRILKHAPNHVPSLILGAAIDLQLKQPAAAEAQIRRVMASSPQHSGARRMLVQIHLASNQPARALEALMPLLTIGAGADPGLSMLAGETYLANGEIRRASSYFAAASDSPAQQATARTRIAEIALTTGDIQLGLKMLEAVIAAGGAPARADHSLIAGYLRANEFDRAVLAAQRLVNREPSALSHQLLGSVFMESKNSAAAREQFSKALGLSPGYLPAAVALGVLDTVAGRPADARHRFEQLIAREPSNEQALLALANVLTSPGSGDAREVAPILQRAVRVNPQSASARLALIRHHLAQKEVSAALNAAQEARAALPNDNLVLFALGEAQEAAGQKNQAAETFGYWAQLESRMQTATMTLAETALRQNKLQAAVVLYRTIVEREPENFIALNNLAWAAGQIGDPTALGYAQRAVKLDPNNAAALDTLGSLLMAQGDNEQALPLLHKASQQAPKRSDIRFNYAKALMKAGKKTVAKSELEALQAMGGDFAGKSEVAAMLRTL